MHKRHGSQSATRDHNHSITPKFKSQMNFLGNTLGCLGALLFWGIALALLIAYPLPIIALALILLIFR